MKLFIKILILVNIFVTNIYADADPDAGIISKPVYTITHIVEEPNLNIAYYQNRDYRYVIKGYSEQTYDIWYDDPNTTSVPNPNNGFETAVVLNYNLGNDSSGNIPVHVGSIMYPMSIWIEPTHPDNTSSSTSPPYNIEEGMYRYPSPGDIVNGTAITHFGGEHASSWFNGTCKVVAKTKGPIYLADFDQEMEFLLDNGFMNRNNPYKFSIYSYDKDVLTAGFTLEVKPVNESEMSHWHLCKGMKIKVGYEVRGNSTLLIPYEIDP